MRNFITFLLLTILCSHEIKAQSSVSSATIIGGKNDSTLSLALRGKLFGFFIIEDIYFSTATLGAELQVKGKHCIGLDYTYFGWQYERDDEHDVAQYENYERRGYALLDYKYKSFSVKQVDVYLNAYGKYGSYNSWFSGASENYTVDKEPFLKDSSKGIFWQYGAGIGIKNYYSERFYWDLSMNMGKQSSRVESITNIKGQTEPLVSTDVIRDKTIFYMRLNLGYKIFLK